MSRIPSLTSLRTFEAAARLLSFTLAAEELHVSQGAVSHQIRLLEEDLDTVLFHRSARKVELTDTGRALSERLSEAFQIVHSAVEATRDDRDPNEVRAVFPPNLAARWLVPRLARFHDAHPGVSLTLRHTSRLDDIEGDIDLAITWNDERPNETAERLMSLSYAPMCAPKLKLEFAFDEVEQLFNCALLGSRDWSWSDWFAKAGIPHRPIKPHTTMDSSSSLINAVLDGQGVGLCPTVYVLDYLAEGRLVRLFDIATRSRQSFFMTHTKRSLARAPVRAFRSWLLNEAETSP
jgi:LysR family transcriptional regulator, glycine cleavage system transcriptional activator